MQCSLSRYPTLTKENIDQYDKHLDSEEVKHVFDAIVNQHRNEETWIASINTISTAYTEIENQILYNAWDKQKVMEDITRL